MRELTPADREPTGRDLTPVEPVDADLAAIVEAVAALPAIPDDPGRYAPRGLTELWLRKCYQRSRNTAKSYHRSLRLWLDYCAEHGLNAITDPRRADVDDWISRQKTTRGPLSLSTVNARLSAVSSWYRYLASNNAADRNPVEGVERTQPDRDDSDTPGMTEDQVAALLDYAEARAATGGEVAQRDYALLSLLVTTALRSGALAHATRADLGTDRGHRVLRYRNKGGKDKRVPVVPEAGAALDAYLETRDRRRTDASVPGVCPTCRKPVGEHLVLSSPYRGHGGDRPLTAKDLGDLLRRTAAAAGIEGAEALVPHSTRHTAITSLLAAGVPITDVQDLAGHADPRTTRRYDRGRDRLDNSPAYRAASIYAQRRQHHGDGE